MAPNMVAQAGDDVYLGSMLTRLHLWGLVSDLDTPAMMSGSLEVLGDEAALVLDALVGPRGPAGANSPIVKMRWSESITTPQDLPKNLLNNDVDKGIAYWIGNIVYVWSGVKWMMHEMGSPGIAGPVPRISPTFEVVDGPSEIDVTGTTTHPSWHMHINRDEVKGPPGPSAAIFNADDYDNVGTPPAAADVGKVLTVVPHSNGLPEATQFSVRAFHGRHVKMFTVPEGAFQNYVGFTQGHEILGYDIVPQPFDYVPFCLGHVKAIGLELSTTPLQVGCEVRLGSPLGGELIGRGHGSPLGWTTLSPHWSTPGDPYRATSPTAPTGFVAAGEVGKIFVTLRTEGLLGAYIFNRSGAHLSILTVPTELVVT